MPSGLFLRRNPIMCWQVQMRALNGHRNTCVRSASSTDVHLMLDPTSNRNIIILQLKTAMFVGKCVGPFSVFHNPRFVLTLELANGAECMPVACVDTRKGRPS